MAWRRKHRPQAGGPGFDERAVVIPLDAHNTFGNESSISPGSKATTQFRLALRSDGPDAVLQGRAQVVKARVPNWLRVVFYYAGSNEGPSSQLPAEVEVSVRVDPTTRRILEVDVGRAEVELAGYRDVAATWWKQDEGPLADVRGVFGAPKEAAQEVRGVADTWRKAAGQMRADARSPAGEPLAVHDEADAEQLRRTANTMAHHVAAKPKLHGRLRASALEAGPMMVGNVRSGSMAMADLEVWLQFQQRSGAITADEAAAWQAQASAT